MARFGPKNGFCLANSRQDAFFTPPFTPPKIWKYSGANAKSTSAEGKILKLVLSPNFGIKLAPNVIAKLSPLKRIYGFKIAKEFLFLLPLPILFVPSKLFIPTFTLAQTLNAFTRLF